MDRRGWGLVLGVGSSEHEVEAADGDDVALVEGMLLGLGAIDPGRVQRNQVGLATEDADEGMLPPHAGACQNEVAAWILAHGELREVDGNLSQRAIGIHHGEESKLSRGH